MNHVASWPPKSDDEQRWYRNGRYFTDGQTLIWEYQRVTPEGEQVDILKVMEIEGTHIVNHRIYWGWYGCNLLIGSAVSKAIATEV